MKMRRHYPAECVGGGTRQHRHGEAANECTHAWNKLDEAGTKPGEAAAHHGRNDVAAKVLHKRYAVQFGQLPHHVDLYGADRGNVGSRNGYKTSSQGKSDVVEDDFGRFRLFLFWTHSVFHVALQLNEVIEPVKVLDDGHKQLLFNKSSPKMCFFLEKRQTEGFTRSGWPKEAAKKPA